MGQKVNPKSFRLPINKNWQSKWFGKADFAKNIAEDLMRSIPLVYDDTAAIGKLYRRQDEVGTPYWLMGG